MPIQVNVNTRPGQTVYIAIRRVSDNAYLKWADSTFEAFVSWPSYAQVVTEDSSIDGLYPFSAEPVEAGVYAIEAYEQVGGSPDKAADTQIDVYTSIYDGASETDLQTVIAMLRALQVGQSDIIESAGGLTPEQDRKLSSIYSRLPRNANGGTNSGA